MDGWKGFSWRHGFRKAWAGSLLRSGTGSRVSQGGGFARSIQAGLALCAGAAATARQPGWVPQRRFI
jgi:hypothetical protein